MLKPQFLSAYFEFPVELPSGERKTWTPNKTTLKKLAAQFGDETDDWQGRKVKLTTARQNVRGEIKNVIYGEPFIMQGPLENPKTTAQVNL